MKKLSVIGIFATMIICISMAPALACEGPNCSNAWVGGENFLDQSHNVYQETFNLGGQLGTGGYQGLSMWGGVHAPGQYGEYESLGYQSEGADFTQPITAGEIQTGHLATQLGEINISGGSANASVWGENMFNVGTTVGAGVTEDQNSVTYQQNSANRNRLNMEGEVCLEGEGTAGYTSEVLTQTGHTQSLDLPGGNAFTESLSQTRGLIKIQK